MYIQTLAIIIAYILKTSRQGPGILPAWPIRFAGKKSLVGSWIKIINVTAIFSYPTSDHYSIYYPFNTNTKMLNIPSQQSTYIRHGWLVYVAPWKDHMRHHTLTNNKAWKWKFSLQKGVSGSSAYTHFDTWLSSERIQLSCLATRKPHQPSYE